MKEIVTFCYFFFRQKTGKIGFTTLGESFRKTKPRSAEAIELIPSIRDAEDLCEVISIIYFKNSLKTRFKTHKKYIF